MRGPAALSAVTPDVPAIESPAVAPVAPPSPSVSRFDLLDDIAGAARQLSPAPVVLSRRRSSPRHVVAADKSAKGPADFPLLADVASQLHGAPRPPNSVRTP